MCVLHTMPSAKKKGSRASDKKGDIAMIVPFGEGGVQHFLNCAFCTKAQVAQLDKMQPDKRSEAMLKIVGEAGVAKARIAMAAYNAQPIGTPDAARVAAAEAALEEESFKWMQPVA